MATAFIALGSNLNNPVLQVQRAMQALAHIAETQVIAQSSLYETAPIGYEDETLKNIPNFINAVVKVNTFLQADILLDALFAIENAAGRERPYINAPRVLDCDLLLYDTLQMHAPKLTLPHPRMHSRGFVLLPLFEIAPTLSLPNHGKIEALLTPELLVGIHKLSTQPAINL